MIGLCGHPIEQSLSPNIHALLHEVPYRLFSHQSLQECLENPHLKALNVTHPYKHEAFLKADHLDDVAQATGVVNTLKRKNGLWFATNTDALALKDLFEAHAPKDLSTRISILGNGATMRSARWALEKLGYRQVRVYARHPQNDEYALNDLSLTTQVLINTTPVGMFHVEDRHRFNLSTLNDCVWVFDAVNQPLRTPLILQAQSLGIKAHGGLGMLVRQAVHGAAFMFERSFGSTSLDSLYQKVLKSTENVVFIGMPYSGKSTLAMRFAKATKRPLHSIDERLIHHFNQPLANVLTDLGEAVFRSAERELVDTLKTVRNAVIDTGGGTVLAAENVERLKGNGLCVWLQAPPPTSFDGSRPLAPNLEAYHTLKHHRHPLYQAAHDITLHRDEDPLKTLKRMETLYEAHYGSQRP